MNKQLNMGVIGLGRLGSLYANYCTNRLPTANLVAVSDIREEVAQSVANQYGADKYYTDYNDLLADSAVEAVLVVTPTSLHRDVVVAAAQAGKAIFCEKPLSLSVNQCKEMAVVIQDTGTFFQLGFMRRFDSAYLTTKQKMEAGEIGKPIQFKGTSRDKEQASLEFLDPKHSGGLFIDMGIHDFDLARWLMGEVKSV
ncbi:MAG: hypothetical protein CMI18_01775 [Opitutaceae bacterium]|nr:hypothetical protein [Opitutaceae bacterium]|tara:strand:- start:848 stop:1438 length:591 start_codon:yes stop_codon:yes gene_type:complete